MALTWGTLLAGVLVGFGLPVLVGILNSCKRGLGWLVLAAIVVLFVIGRILENAGVG